MWDSPLWLSALQLMIVIFIEMNHLVASMLASTDQDNCSVAVDLKKVNP